MIRSTRNNKSVVDMLQK